MTCERQYQGNEKIDTDWRKIFAKGTADKGELYKIY